MLPFRSTRTRCTFEPTFSLDRAMTPKQTFDYSQLTPLERLELAQEIWDSVDEAQVEWPLTEAQRNELDRRLEEYEQDPDGGRDWDVVHAELLQKLAQRRASAA